MVRNNMEILIEKADGRPVNVSIDCDHPLELMLTELQTIPVRIFPSDPRRRAELRWLLDVAVARALKAAARVVLEKST
jgi:hypothetical protein